MNPIMFAYFAFLTMNVDKLSQRIRGFVVSNKGILRQLPNVQSQMLELAAIMAAADHYKSFGYELKFQNPGKRRAFVVKSSSRGYPWNFSHIVVKRDVLEFEVHMNLSVLSARDPGIYCVDVAVTQAGVVPQAKQNWGCLPNESLVTFAEVKKLIVYPMLLAHFIGIVHEITPGFLSHRPTGLDDANHFAPALITIGYFTANSREIVAAYKGRGISVNVEANFDVRFSSPGSFRFGPAEPVSAQDTQPAEPIEI
jgi:hypothetical protein